MCNDLKNYKYHHASTDVVLSKIISAYLQVSVKRSCTTVNKSLRIKPLRTILIRCCNSRLLEEIHRGHGLSTLWICKHFPKFNHRSPPLSAYCINMSLLHNFLPLNLLPLALDQTIHPLDIAMHQTTTVNAVIARYVIAPFPYRDNPLPERIN